MGERARQSIGEPYGIIKAGTQTEFLRCLSSAARDLFDSGICNLVHNPVTQLPLDSKIKLGELGHRFRNIRSGLEKICK